MACPVCDEAGEHFHGTPVAERAHFLQRMLWAAHRARQAHEQIEGHSTVIRDELSSLIRRLDEVASLLVLPDGVH